MLVSHVMWLSPRRTIGKCPTPCLYDFEQTNRASCVGYPRNERSVGWRMVSEVSPSHRFGMDTIKVAAQRVSWHLNNAFECCTADAEQSRESDQTLRAYGAAFHGSAIPHGSHKGDKSAVHKVKLLYSRIRVVKDLPSLQNNRRQMRAYALECRSWQSPQNPIGHRNRVADPQNSASKLLYVYLTVGGLLPSLRYVRSSCYFPRKRRKRAPLATEIIPPRRAMRPMFVERTDQLLRFCRPHAHFA
jgi:hypothetical protein